MITAKIIADSISKCGKRITTYELEYPRMVHAEVMTHRVFSRNAASSRAIPLKTMIKMVWDNPAMPVYWGKNQAGMSAKEQLVGWRLNIAKSIWKYSGRTACLFAKIFDKIGLHKQISNRILEPWTWIKVVLTSTEFDNFFYLRRHPDAQPEIQELANVMWDAREKSVPRILEEGEWHLPYITWDYDPIKKQYISDNEYVPLDVAQKLSASLCAQVSYRKADESVDKAIIIYNRLVESKPVHASPFEHQATPLNDLNETSGNFKGWRQYRQTIKDNVCNHYDVPQKTYLV